MNKTEQHIIFFTVATHKNHHLERLLTSAKHHNININICGMGEEYLGNGKKRILMHQFLKTCPADAIFMFIDAYDVIFLANESEISHKYNTHFKHKLVISGEQNLGMYSADDLFCYLKYPIKKERFKYLNSGSIIGPVQKGIELFEAVGLDCETIKMDQPDLIRYFIKHPTKLTIDTQHILFGVNGGRAGLEERDYKINNNRLYCTVTKTEPILFHVPGKLFIGLDKIAYKLGFMKTLPSYTKQEIKAYQTAQRDHIICEKLGLENYVYRLLKNWSINFLILGILFFLIRFLLTLI
ncbi:hypothetical protein DID76_01365 [Candidatus Marinamargulisbacteria bacterium SCGC AG-414-C22]|nr:hypothetical protein DID76_01365 [Candidatus Marinamargulisbacteria bacterium SCGC AG-414-C22]